MTRSLMVMAAVLTLSAGCSYEVVTNYPFEAAGRPGSVYTTAEFAPGFAEEAGRIGATLNRTVISLDVRNPQSEIARLNHSGSSASLPLGEPTFRLLDLCRYYHDLTGGAFDITTARLQALWLRGIPQLDDIARVLEHTGIEHLRTTDNRTAIFLTSGLLLTPGLTTHAYALDMCAVEARRRFGGPILIEYAPFARSIGTFPADTAPIIPIRVPERFDGIPVGHIRFEEPMAFVNRFLPHRDGQADEEIRSILIDGRTGYPAVGTRQVAVTGPLAVKAHALAEALLIVGREKGSELLDAFEGYDVMLVTDDDPVEIWMTPGFRNRFTPNPESGAAFRDWTRD